MEHIIFQFSAAGIQSEIDNSKNQVSDRISSSDWSNVCKDAELETIIGSPPDSEPIPVSSLKPQRHRRKVKPVSYIAD